VPFGVIGIIYEARPNVTFDVAGLCLKSGNVCVLKGGSDAGFSNQAIVSIIHKVFENNNIDPNIVCLLPFDREATAQLLKARKYVDLLIPRGSQSLIDFVRNNATIPVIETGAGICHTYFDESGDNTKGQAIINNAKTRRVSVCNALDCLIIHQSRLNDLPFLCEKLADSDVEIFADTLSLNALSGHYPKELLKQASSEDYATEFLSYKMSVKTVGNIDEALDHIALNSSKHSEAIITEDINTADQFLKRVDAAVVYVNTSTAFTDGAQFGLGAEIGISTQKLHARGPMGLEELTSYKWLVDSKGEIRNP
jgi:glutamate-5-semialdehyde dehydrogenase